jgi:hypothetical protein
MKKEIRILGISDGFSYRSSVPRKVAIVGVVFRGGRWLEGVMRSTVEKDSANVTSRIVEMIRSSPHFQQTRLIMTDGLSFAGFNIINIKTLHQKTDIPVVAVSKRRREVEYLRQAVRRLSYKNSRRKALENAGRAFSWTSRETKIPIQLFYAGASTIDLRSVMKATCKTKIPEPIRVARILSSALNRYLTKQLQKD